MMTILVFAILCLQHCMAFTTGTQLQAELDELKVELEKVKTQHKAEITEVKTFVQTQVQAELDELKALVKTLQKERAEKVANTIGFTAFLNDDVEVAEDNKIPFSRVQFNEGDDYSGSNSEFTCTISGIYFFYSSASTGENTGSTQIVRNDGSTEYHLATIVNSGGHWDQASNSAVTRCNSGDRVYVKNSLDGGTYYRASREESDQQTYFTSSFSGFLVALE